MSHFLRLLSDADKAEALLEVCARLRFGVTDARAFSVEPEDFQAIPGMPFAYWVSRTVRATFERLPPLEHSATLISGTGTLDDFRFLRTWWEASGAYKWFPFAKGGSFARIYFDYHLLVNWAGDGSEMKAWIVYRYRGGHWARNIRSIEHYFRPGLTWPRRKNGLSFRVMPAGFIFADKGPAAFVANDDPDALLALGYLLNSAPFGLLVSVQLARVELAQSFEVGLIQKTPLPDLDSVHQAELAALARRAWSLKRTLDTTTETSHAFLLPTALRDRLSDFNPSAIETELVEIQSEVDAIAFDLYGFSEADREAALGPGGDAPNTNVAEDDEDAPEPEAPPVDALLSWAVGVAFGRFDWRLATGERLAPSEPGPFDPLPQKSPGMLPYGANPFHAHAGIMVDDQGHQHDLARLVEEVLTRVDEAVPDDVRRWLSRDFFAYHLKRYSKSRRRATIYWPLSTTTGSYTLWLYYPSLSSQTLYTAINDFVEPKLKQTSTEVTGLSNKSTTRTRDDEKRLEELQAFELELIELRDTLLKYAPTYKPHHDDGVQISAAPLWPLFRNRTWQKILKDTWTKLENGQYDWAHLAMNYWPDRVHDKCQTNKSLAIAHKQEELFVEPRATPKKTQKTGAGQ